MSDDDDNNFSDFKAGSKKTVYGPARWFSVQVPSHLNLVQTAAFLELRPATDSTSMRPEVSSEESDASEQTAGGAARKTAESTAPWSMTLYAAWVEKEEPETNAASFHPVTLFPQVAQYCTAAPLNLPGKCQTWAGLSSPQTNRRWWQSLFRRRLAYEWRLWIVEHRDIVIVASLQSVPGLALPDQVAQICTEVLNSMQFADVLAHPPERFRRDVIALSKRHLPLLDVKPSGSFSIRVGKSEINLTNFYRAYLCNPSQMKQVVLPGLTTFVRMQEMGPEQLAPHYSEISSKIMPMLSPDSDNSGHAGLKDCVQIPWVGGLRIMFVMDGDTTYSYVHKQLLKFWKLSLEELEQQAMQNLAVYAEDHPLEFMMVGEDRNNQILVPSEPGAYNSVRLLGDHLHFQLRQLLGSEFVVGVPNRDFFVAVSLGDQELIDKVQQRVREDFQTMHHPLTSRLLVISADGVSEYCGSRGDV